MFLHLLIITEKWFLMLGEWGDQTGESVSVTCDGSRGLRAAETGAEALIRSPGEMVSFIALPSATPTGSLISVSHRSV